jgi:murein DD-endopeptidase MepM/ murein hydrolase activator NlpD
MRPQVNVAATMDEAGGELLERALDPSRWALPNGVLGMTEELLSTHELTPELEERLVDAPLDSWEQVTSLLRDGRRHKGVDFKTPVGTPVKATFDGVVARKNWNFRGNGNSIELQESGGKGRTALYLHLAELPKSLAVGQKFKRGEVMAKSGNTGHSFAPHLHYQLMSGDKVIDPFESHATMRASLPAADKAAFDKRKAELGGLFPTEVAAT